MPSWFFPFRNPFSTCSSVSISDTTITTCDPHNPQLLAVVLCLVLRIFQIKVSLALILPLCPQKHQKTLAQTQRYAAKSIWTPEDYIHIIWLSHSRFILPFIFIKSSIFLAFDYILERSVVQSVFEFIGKVFNGIVQVWAPWIQWRDTKTFFWRDPKTYCALSTLWQQFEEKPHMSVMETVPVVME